MAAKVATTVETTEEAEEAEEVEESTTDHPHIAGTVRGINTEKNNTESSNSSAAKTSVRFKQTAAVNENEKLVLVMIAQQLRAAKTQS